MVQRSRLQHPSVLKKIFSFPDAVNEYAARTVAAFVVALSLIYIVTGNIFILAFLTYGFWARVLTGPTLSPLALLTTKVIIPAVGNPILLCPGPHKRFAQFIGAVFTTAALGAVYIQNTDVSFSLIAVLTIFASLESFLGFCAGCWFFKRLMAWGVIPEAVCEKCNNILPKAD